MPCEFRDEVVRKDHFYKCEWLLCAYDSQDELLAVCENQFALAEYLGVCQNTIDRLLPRLWETGKIWVRAKGLGIIRVELLNAFQEDIGVPLGSVLPDWEGYFDDWVKIYTYDHPYQPKGTPRRKWVYEGSFKEVPKDWLGETVKRMSYMKGELRIWITTPKKTKKGRKSRDEVPYL